jgi:hypothetical protein
MTDATKETLEGIIYKELHSGTTAEEIKELVDAISALITLEKEYTNLITSLKSSLEPFLGFVKNNFPELTTTSTTEEEFIEGAFAFLQQLKKNPAYAKKLISLIAGKEVQPVETSDDKVIYNFLKNNNIH